jgi:hypothetical protein
MASTYVNDLRLNEMATGDASGSWGTVTNTNLELIGEAFSYGTETIGDADSTLTIADGAADAARSFYLKITSSVDLTTTRIVTLAPNTVSKVWMIENATTGSQVITIKQGSGATINVPNGQVKMISTDGAGSGGAVLDLLVDVDLTGTTTLVNLNVSGAVDIAGDLTLSAGGDGALRFTAASSVKVLDNNAAALVFEEADNAYMTFVTTDGSEAVKFDKALDINAATQIDATVTVGVDDTGYDVKFFGATTGKSLLWDESADSLIVTGTTTLVGTTNLDAVDIDGATQIDATVTVGVDDTGYDVKFFGATAGKYMLWDESADTLEVSGTVTADGLTVDGSVSITDAVNAKLSLSGPISSIDMYDTSSVNSNTRFESHSNGLFIKSLNDDGTATQYIIELNCSNGNIIFFDDTSTEGVHWNAATKRLGIGTVSADTALDVTGTITADGLTVDGAVDMASTLTVDGVVTANAGVVVDNFTLDGTTLALSSGDLTLDVAGDIILDSDNGVWRFKDAGTTIFQVTRDGDSYCGLYSGVSNMVMRFQGNDGGSTITALTLDMSEAGAATLNNGLTLTDGNLVIGTAGKGIDFSAVTGGTGTATGNVLDDYEEGTWTPAFAYSTAGTSSFGYNDQVGHYVKVGDIVHFQSNVRLNAFTKGTGSGSFLLTGFPYTAHNTGGYAHAQVSISLYGWTFSNIPVASVIDNTTYCHINTMSSNAIFSPIADPDSASMVWITGTYRAA